MGRLRTIDDADILKHARLVFREGGHAASTREIARRAGISQAVLYQRFGSKEDLFLAAMTPEPPDLEALLGAYPPRDARAHLEALAERLMDFFASLTPTLLHVLAHPQLGGARLVEWHAGLPFRALVDGLTTRFASLRDDGLVGPVDPHSAALAFLAAVHSAALFEMLSGAAHPPRAPRLGALVDTLWQGFAPHGRGSGNTD
jgi:AcrR family transcriptional regulator